MKFYSRSKSSSMATFMHGSHRLFVFKLSNRWPKEQIMWEGIQKLFFIIFCEHQLQVIVILKKIFLTVEVY